MIRFLMEGSCWVFEGGKISEQVPVGLHRTRGRQWKSSELEGCRAS